MRITIFTILSGFLFYTPAVLAIEDEPKQIPWYQVELILFEHASKTNIESEKWLEEIVQLDTSSTIELFDPDNPNNVNTIEASTPTHDRLKKLTPYVLIKDKNKLKLQDAYRSITRSSRETDILYLTWMQPTVNREKAQAVHIHGGIEYPNVTTPTYQEPLSSTVPVIADDSNQQEQGQENTGMPLNIESESLFGPPPPDIIEQIDGSITLSVSRYLHIWTDIVFSQPVKQGFSSDPDASEFKLIRFPMKQHRRMRSNEIHYLDHPLFGILVLITPVELPKPEEKPEEIEAPKETATLDAGKKDINKGKIKNTSGN